MTNETNTRKGIYLPMSLWTDVRKLLRKGEDRGERVSFNKFAVEALSEKVEREKKGEITS